MDNEIDFDPTQCAGDRSNQSIIVDTGKHAAMLAVCAIVCGMCAAISWWAIHKQDEIATSYRDDSLYVQEQYQKERNHVIELEARLKILGDEVQELKHHE